MAGKTLSALPSWVTKILEAWGADVDSALAKVNELLDKVDAPAELREKIMAFFSSLAVNVKDPVALQLLVTSIALELTSGHPGYNASHGGLA